MAKMLNICNNLKIPIYLEQILLNKLKFCFVV